MIRFLRIAIGFQILDGGGRVVGRNEQFDGPTDGIFGFESHHAPRESQRRQFPEDPHGHLGVDGRHPVPAGPHESRRKYPTFLITRRIAPARISMRKSTNAFPRISQVFTVAFFRGGDRPRITRIFIKRCIRSYNFSISGRTSWQT